jgi:hypothetical protein
MNKDLVQVEGMQKAFLKGSNSSCHQHLRQHFKEYKSKCEDANIPTHHWAIPQNIWNKMEEEKEGRGKTGRQAQSTLDGMIEMTKGPREFTQDGVLHAVAQLVACDDQVGAVVI